MARIIDLAAPQRLLPRSSVCWEVRMISLLFRVPCPTPDGRTARELYEKRLTSISDEMRADARAYECRYHRAWYASDGHAFYALAIWRSREDASAFYRKWDITDEPGEETVSLKGDVGLVTEAGGA